MSVTKERVPIARARQLAESLVMELSPACQRIEIAGSSRRRAPFVGDVEIVAIPHEAERLVVGRPGNRLDQALAALCAERKLIRLKDGDRYKQFEVVHAACRLDLFLCTPASWGWIFLLRTGPQSFTKDVVCKKSMGGLCPPEVTFRDGRLVRLDRVLDAPEEADVFKALGLRYVDPWDRR
jgi:DNA polymerase/3'-5' exonuclease PolX